MAAKKKKTSKKKSRSRSRSAAPSASAAARHLRTARLPNAQVAELQLREIESLRAEVLARKKELLPRWNANPEDVQKSVAQLVLTLVEFLRKLLERQAIRRMEAESLTPEEIEKIGLALMKLEETVHDLAASFGLSPEELNLDLGPLGRLV